jgi:hypothetical protein
MLSGRKAVHVKIDGYGQNSVSAAVKRKAEIQLIIDFWLVHGERTAPC